MKKIVLIIFLLALATSSKAYAWKDICREASKTPYMTSFKLDEYFEDDINDGLFDVKGKIKNVYSKNPSTGLYDVKVDCGNNITVIVATKDSSVEELKTGDKVRFSGRCYKFRRYSSRNSDKARIRFWFLDGQLK